MLSSTDSSCGLQYESCVHCCTQQYKLDDFVTGTKFGVIKHMDVPYDFFELGTETWFWLHTTIYWHLAVVPSTFFYTATVHIHCKAKFPKLSALRASTQLKGYSDENIFVIMNISSNTSSSENNWNNLTVDHSVFRNSGFWLFHLNWSFCFCIVFCHFCCFDGAVTASEPGLALAPVEFLSAFCPGHSTHKDVHSLSRFITPDNEFELIVVYTRRFLLRWTRALFSNYQHPDAMCSLQRQSQIRMCKMCCRPLHWLLCLITNTLFWQLCIQLFANNAWQGWCSLFAVLPFMFNV